MEGRILRSWVLVMMYLLGGCATTLGAAYQDQMKPETVARWLSWRASEAGRNLDEQSLWDQRLAQDVRPKLDLGDAGLARRAHGIYHQRCSPCHGTPGQKPNLPIAPALGGQGYRFGMLMGGDNMARGIFDVISQGRNQMPAFAGQMTNEQIWLMVEYLRSF